ncbi:helix-turn-helix domain-containing protein [Culicoidibacter larvae]|nr:helix-turn-helix domain-containing protein [Culicoidibacter larvae]
MKIFLSTSQERQVKLIKLLADTPKYSSIPEIAKRLNCGITTVSRDISEINTIFVENHIKEAEILISHWGILLVTGVTFNIKKILLIYLKSSIPFTYFNLVFNAKTIQTINFIEQFYISESTFYRNIKSLTHFLQDNKIGLIKKQDAAHVLIGDEKKIRQFAFHYYWYAYQGMEWPFPNIDRAAILDFINELNRKHNLNYSKIDKEKYLYVIAVSLIRVQQGNFIKIYNNEVFQFYNIQPLSQDLKSFFVHLGLSEEQSQTEALYLFLYTRTLVTTLSSKIDRIFAMEMHKESDTFIHKMALLITEAVQETFDLTLNMRDQDTVNELFSLSYSLIFNSISPDIFEIYSWIDYFSNSYPLLITHLDALVKKINEGFNKILPNFYYQITKDNEEVMRMQFIQFLLKYIDTNQFLPKIRIKIYSSREPYMIQYIESTISNKLDINPEFVDADEQNYDLLLTDALTPELVANEKKKIVLWSFPFSVGDFERLKDFIIAWNKSD